MFVFITVTGKNRSGYIPHESKIKLFHSHTLCKHSHTLQTFTHSLHTHTVKQKPRTFLRKRDRFAVFLGGLAGMWEGWSGNTAPNKYINIAYWIGCFHLRGFKTLLSLLRHAWAGTLIICSLKAMVT